ncbi:LysM peptidoglycan-binding domain-containing protein [Clostridium botulinum]|uniref:M14 family metallopeptidase n=1 Tax=Clostridium TaxID=1485 RepID=UPI001A90E97D|nr:MULTISPECIES: M14 family metallopeptidase [Clostridium]MBO0525699.1 LysM peptidoglycan-binding domain-containing protein [Clostridium botulinum]MBO0526835.1 LysM peptidoglycan-binding domain-containing protein [Clostridium botulinum]MBO0532259.1 LysM peptidoglycan-binding domain-containing protein [Clostridium botulinum]MBO0536752.1 LysM peptidoglycan-binding domain-containing protein [Clostridium botulinum]MBO0538348.1 LysM peptidoglycan-binding domain-containing protein [Clostridium botul
MRVLKKGDRGSDVKKIQAVLQKIGYDVGPIDGIFGSNTEEAVKRFQLNNRLAVDGIIGPKTYEVLNKFILGYNTYTIKPGDTLYNIAKRHYTTVARIITANPNIEPNNLIIGQQIIVPVGINIVDTNVDYTYGIMESDIKALKARYPFIQVGIAGKSVLGKNLYYIKLGSGPNEVFYNGAHHALEWITAPLLMKFIEDFSKAYSEGSEIKGYNIRDIWNRSSIYIMPMVNPDGVDLVINGLQVDNPYYEDLIEWNKGSMDFSQNWQANIRGVDLNHNYNASWYESKIAEESYGIYGPGPTRYGGPYPESEPESRNVADFTRRHNFRLILAYHSQGEVIFWTYRDIIPPGAREIGELFSKVSGYELSEPYGIASYAGYKDWFISEYRRPGFTIEVGKGTNPLPISQFDEIYKDNIEILLLAPIV